LRANSYYMIGLMNENGEGTEHNLTIAVRNYRKAVDYSMTLESDGRMALLRLGEQVEDPSTFVDIPKTLLSGLTAESMFLKGLEYENGLNDRNVSLPKAYGYIKAAAEKHHTKAILKMGDIYISPYYPFNDKAKADKYYSKALKAFKNMESFSGEACYILGRMYKNGYGVMRDIDVATDYFKRAAEKRSAEGHYELGLIYEEELEPVDAFTHFMKSAELGFADGMFRVAQAFDSGKGTAKNKEKAFQWYSKCAETDSQAAKAARKELETARFDYDEKE
ncbi:MAG: sel1 repeat family protein, partial [Muribaculaceae bacterium]|nr:sel1 repeat family protein [Muribaculaceae bacterium]